MRGYIQTPREVSGSYFKALRSLANRLDNSSDVQKQFVYILSGQYFSRARRIVSQNMLVILTNHKVFLWRGGGKQCILGNPQSVDRVFRYDLLELWASEHRQALMSKMLWPFASEKIRFPK